MKKQYTFLFKITKYQEIKEVTFIVKAKNSDDAKYKVRDIITDFCREAYYCPKQGSGLFDDKTSLEIIKIEEL